MSSVLLVDKTGSVSGNTNYFQIVDDVYKSIDENTKLVTWNYTANECTRKEFEYWLLSKKGERFTIPSCCVDYISHECKKIWFISDGLIDDREVTNFITKMQSKFPIGHKFDEINIVLINTGGDINFSTIAGFSKYDCELSIKVYDKNKILEKNNSMNTIKIFETLAKMKKLNEFNEELVEAIRILVLGCEKDDKIVLNIRSEILRLKNIFQKEIDEEVDEEPIELEQFILEANKSTNDYEKLISCVEQIHLKFHTKRLSGNKLINLIRALCILDNGLKNYGIHAGLFQSENGLSGLAITNAQEEVDSILEEGGDCEDPLTMEDTYHTIPIKKTDTSMFPSGSITLFKKFPLLFNPKKELFLPVMGYDGMMKVVEFANTNRKTINHISTRDEMYKRGFIIFPINATDSVKNDIVQYNNKTISDILFNGKKVGNMNLFYFDFALRMLTVPFLTDFYPQIKEEIQWRLNYMINATFCGNSTEFPHQIMSIKNAFIFTILSTVVCKSSTENPILMHISYVSKILELLVIRNIELPEEITYHLELIQKLMKMLNTFKEDQKNRSGRMQLSEIREQIGWQTILSDRVNVPLGINLNEDEQTTQNIMFEERIQEIMKFDEIEIAEFCSLYDLFQGKFLNVPHIPFKLQIKVTPFNHSFCDCNEESFCKSIVNYITSKKIPSYNDISIKSYIFYKKLLLPDDWEHFIANKLNSDIKIEEFIEKYTVKYYYSFRKKLRTRFARKTRRRKQGKSKAQVMRECNGYSY